MSTTARTTGSIDTGLVNNRNPDNFLYHGSTSSSNTIVLYDGTGGKTTKTSAVVVSDGANVSGVVDLAMTGNLNARNPDNFVLNATTSVDNTIPRFDGTGGKTIQTSGITISDTDDLASVKTITLTNTAGNGIEFGTGGDRYIGSYAVDKWYLYWNDTAKQLEIQTPNGPVYSGDPNIGIFNKMIHYANVDLSNNAMINVATLNTRNPDNFIFFAGVSTDNTIPRFDGTGGKTIQTSGVTISDTDSVTGVVDLTMTGNLNTRNPDNFVFHGATSTDNTVPRFNGTGGKTIQTSGVTISDTDDISNGSGSITTTGTITGGAVQTTGGTHSLASKADTSSTSVTGNWSQNGLNSVSTYTVYYTKTAGVVTITVSNFNEDFTGSGGGFVLFNGFGGGIPSGYRPSQNCNWPIFLKEAGTWGTHMLACNSNGNLLLYADGAGSSLAAGVTQIQSFGFSYKAA